MSDEMSNESEGRQLQIGMVIFPGFTLQDLAGPQTAFGLHAKTHIIWKTLEPVPTDKGLGFGAGITAVSARELTLPNTVSVPGYALLDAQTSYDFDRYTISVSAVNLTGRKVFETFQYLGSPVALPTQPRSAYLTLTTRF